MSNTPFAYAVCSVLHRSVEFKANKRHSLFALSPLPQIKRCYRVLWLYNSLVTKVILRGVFSFGPRNGKVNHLAIILVISSTAILRCSGVPMMGSPFAKGLSTSVNIALKINLASSSEMILKVSLSFFKHIR